MTTSLALLHAMGQRQRNRHIFQTSLSMQQTARHFKSAAFRDVTHYCVSQKLTQLPQHTNEE
jgi:hypothetical protein